MSQVGLKKIGTHSGTFHCDEALGCFLLRLTDEFKDCEVVRSRDPDVLSKLDIIIDVGAVYDPSKHRYDHHQRGFIETLDLNHKTKLSSSGLVYKHFGREIISKYGEVSENLVDELYMLMYEDFMEELDAVDNGVNQYDTDILPRYHVTTSLSHRVSLLNSPWNDPEPKQDENFKKAMNLTGEEFFTRLLYYSKVLLPARGIVKTAIENRFSVDPSGFIIVLDKICPWEDDIFEIEKQYNAHIKHILYKDNNTWMIRSVPIFQKSFENRCPFPEPWRGLRDKDLDKVTGIPNCVFVHATGFVGGNKSYEGAIEMSRRTLNL